MPDAYKATDQPAPGTLVCIVQCDYANSYGLKVGDVVEVIKADSDGTTLIATDTGVIWMNTTALAPTNGIATRFDGTNFSDEEVIPEGTVAVITDTAESHLKIYGYTVGMRVVVVEGDTDGTCVISADGLDSLWISNSRLARAEGPDDLLRAFQGL